MFSTTENALFIVELREPFERLQIQFMPQELNWQRQANIASTTVVGRNNPHYQLTGGEDKLALQLDFYSDQADRRDVMQKVAWLQSLTMNNGFAGPVRNVRLIWGSLFSKEVWIVNSVNAKLSQFMPRAGMLPQQAYVDLALSLDTKTNRRITDVRR